MDDGERPRGNAAVADALQHVLGNSFQLIFTTTSFRWNAAGPMAPLMQELFASQAAEMQEALEPMAHRIRALGAPALANYADEVVVPLVGAGGALPMVEQMVGILRQGHEAMTRAVAAAGDVADGVEDRATAHLLAARELAHDTHRVALASLIEPRGADPVRSAPPARVR